MTPGRRGRTRAANSWRLAPSSALLLVLDVLDHLGHVVLVLAELRCVLEHFFLFFLFLFLGPAGLGLDLGFYLFLDDRLGDRLDRRDDAHAARLQERLGIEVGAAFRAHDRIVVKIVVARAAIRADTLRSPLDFGQTCLPWAPGTVGSAALCHEALLLSKLNRYPYRHNQSCAREAVSWQSPAPRRSSPPPRARFAGGPACRATNRSRIARSSWAGSRSAGPGCAACSRARTCCAPPRQCASSAPRSSARRTAPGSSRASAWAASASPTMCSISAI